MYYPDLSPYPNESESSVGGYRILSIGWLAVGRPYTQGKVTLDFLNRLWIFCCHAVLYTLGFHKCPFCGVWGVVAHHGQEARKLGSAEIRVVGRNNIIYAAPDLIYHYVADHHYRPPDEFIQAVLEGPLPGSSEYEIALKLIGVEEGTP